MSRLGPAVVTASTITALLALCILGGCKDRRRETSGNTSGNGPGTAVPSPTDDASTTPLDGAPTFRLDDTAAPLAYNIELSLVPTDETFTGAATIDIEVARETRTLWMHGHGLDDIEATLTVGDDKLEAEIRTGPHDLLGFHFPKPIAPGRVTLHARYKGVIERRDGVGVFAEKEGDELYLYTQFESLDARRAFPCFDEPRWKTPWKLTLVVPAAQTALANTPIESETLSEDKRTRRVEFLETKPLPTYLVAFAVGPFEAVDAGKTSSGVPMRIITPKGRGAEAAYAAKVTGQIVARLESYFGTPYPYRKLDTLVIPTTQGFGAMEHPGLITFSSRIVLWKPSQETFERQRDFALTQVHEIGHQWFGNLVTMPWWDDIWLNEAFASWIENRVLADWRPAWKLEAVAMANKEEAMLIDSLASSRQIREPVDDESGVESAFDAITYLKGEAVLNMFETFVGRDAWQKGIRHYLDKFKWKTATSADFLAAVGEGSGKTISAAFNTFLEQNGVPLIKMTLRCDKGAAPTLDLAQSRYIPLGSKAASARTWQLPICVTHSGGEACTLLADKKGSLALGAVGAACPTWINPNKGGVGYYRADTSRELRDAVYAEKRVSFIERLNLIGDIDALTRSGAVKIDETFEVIKRLAAERDPILTLAGVTLAEAVFPMLDPDDSPRYQRFLVKTFASAVKRVGWTPRRGESSHVAELRPKLLMLVGGHGEDSATVSMASARAGAWLDGKAVVPAEMLGAILSLAARNGDAALLERMRARALATDNRIERRELLVAIGHFRFGVTDAALEVALDDKLDGRDGVTIIRTAAKWPETDITTLRFVMKNYDKLAKRLSESQLGRLPERLSHICTARPRQNMAAFFAERSAALPGGVLTLKQAIETIDLCIATRLRQGDQATSWLQSY